VTDLSAAATTTAPSQRPRIFYGWWIVLGAIVAQFVAIGMQVSVSGVFLVPMTEDLDWSRSQFTLATTAGNAISAGIGFFIVCGRGLGADLRIGLGIGFPKPMCRCRHERLVPPQKNAIDRHR